MSSLTDSIPTARSQVVVLVAECVEELAGLAGVGCLIEGPDGQLVGHCLLDEDAPRYLLNALVTGSLAGLHGAMTARRTTGVLPSGPVVEGRIGDGRATFLCLRDGDLGLGAVWLISADRSVPLANLQTPIQRLIGLLACTSDAPDETCLEGGPLPPSLAGAERLWVSRLLADTSPRDLMGALIGRTSPFVLQPVRCGQNVYVVAAGSGRVTPERVPHAIQAICLRAETRLGRSVTAGISDRVTVAGLLTARAQADAAARAAAPGACAALRAVRSALVLEHLAAAMTSLPDLGPDPLRILIDYDSRRGTELTGTLLAWLDAFGDVPSAAAGLGVHCNTLRYRLRRTTEILGLDLKLDPHTRVALHLQLLTGKARPRLAPASVHE